MQRIDAIITANRNGQTIAIPSICSAHPQVLAASLLLAEQYDTALLVEATSNQVNQHGGYTGMKPADFVKFTHDICHKLNISTDRLIFGGDHLGPQVWRENTADFAMEQAIDLVQAYVRAGFTKIHLDCSEGCKGEAAQVGDDLAASRAAILAKACEEAAPDASKLRYIVGTEVPPPGGARADEANMTITPTEASHANTTIIKHQQAFAKIGLEHVWDKVIGLVVQPGLEFAPDHVFPFDMSSPDELSAMLNNHPNLCYEAHSTDYQNSAVYHEIARRHFAIHKVGPALTFSYRQAIYSLEAVEKWLAVKNPSQICQIMEDLMNEKTEYWQKHYAGDENQLKLLRHFGYADRIRYYWAIPQAQKSVKTLMNNLDIHQPMQSLLEQFFDKATLNRAQLLQNSNISWAEALILAQIQQALRPYFSVYCPQKDEK